LSIPFPSLNDPLISALLGSATPWLCVFLLVVARLGGLLMMGPPFSSPAIPPQLRIGLILALSFLIAPGLIDSHSADVFNRLDKNADGVLAAAEIPESLSELAVRQRTSARLPEDANLAAADFPIATPRPRTLAELVCLLVAELGLGLALGLGLQIFVSALPLAGQIIDQQTGVSLGEIFNPELGTSTTLTGHLLHLLGVVIFLLAGGHLLVLEALVETFHVLPIGAASLSPSLLLLLQDLVQQSLILAIRIAAPVLSTLVLVGLSLGIISRAVPQLNIFVIGFPVRIATGLVIFGLAALSLGEMFAGQVPLTIDQLRRTLWSS
jgi:flagellar biosynthetic protein FliR